MKQLILLPVLLNQVCMCVCVCVCVHSHTCTFKYDRGMLLDSFLSLHAVLFSEGDTLYSAGDDPCYIYFILRGQ